MKIQDIISVLEKTAAPALQEAYDNTGLLTGHPSWECKGIITCLDSTPEVIGEAIAHNCNLVIAHHPIIFKGLKKITGKNYVEETVIQAIKNDIAVYAIHTNLDNVIEGVNRKIAELIGLKNLRILQPQKGTLQKLAIYVPVANKENLLNALFAAGAGNIGHYSECSFASAGTGSFKGDLDTQPFVGKPGERHYEAEEKLEVIFPAWKAGGILAAMRSNHPYEEIAYDLYALENNYLETGAGMVGELAEAMGEKELLEMLKRTFGTPVIRHSRLSGKEIRTVAVCGGAGSFLTGAAITGGADAYISSDIKYHEFFDANDRLLLADIGHFESEQFTIDLLFDLLSGNFPNFAIRKTAVVTNPVRYFF